MKAIKITGATILTVALFLAICFAPAAEADQACPQTTGVTTDVIAEQVSGFYVDPAALNSNTGQTQAYFTVAAGTYSFVGIRVQDSAGNVVATVLTTSLQGPGAHVVTWYGKDAYGRPVAEGHYNMVMLAGLFLPQTWVAPLTVDNTPPVTTAEASGTLSPSGWYTSNVVLILTAEDALSGVAGTYYRLDSGPWTRYTGSVTISSDGSHTLDYYSTDNVRNTEATKSIAVRIDRQPPSTAIRITGTKSSNGYYTTTPVVYLTATDALSGVDNTMYSLDGDPWIEYTVPLPLGDGNHTLLYRSTDVAGNVEQARSATIRCILEAPAVVYTYPAGGDAGVPLNSAVTATFNQDLIPASVNPSTFSVRSGGTLVPASVTYYDDNRTAVLVPDSPLAANRAYNATVTTGVMNQAQVPMPANYAWSFSTVPPSLSGYAYVDSNGNGRHDAGDPGIPGCRIMLMNTGTWATSYATTNGDGYYEFPGLANGAYNLILVTVSGPYLPATPTSTSVSINNNQVTSNFGFSTV